MNPSTAERIAVNPLLEEAPELLEHLAGSTLKEIGEQRGLSYETARRSIQVQSREIVTHIAGQLLVAWREGKALPIGVIPDTTSQGLSLGLRWVDYLVGQVEELKLFSRVEIEPVNGGYVVALAELKTDAEEAN